MHGGTERSYLLTPLKETFIFITNINQQPGSDGVRGLGGGGLMGVKSFWEEV